MRIKFGLDDAKDNNSGEECTTPMNEEKTQGVSGSSGNWKGSWYKEKIDMLTLIILEYYAISSGFGSGIFNFVDHYVGSVSYSCF